MQKKILAAAVAGALGAPAIGMAQTASTVQVYGTIYGEVSYYDQKRAPGTAVGGPELNNVDYFRTAGSEIGIKGEEALGGGLAAWFQCSSTVDFRGFAPIGWCSRNSALGMKGAFGNIFFGIWDTPTKRTYAIGNVGSGETGGFGNAMVLMGGTTVSVAPVVGGASVTNRGTFSRRETQILNYDSPNIGGFQVLAAIQHATLATAITANSQNNKPRTMSLGGQYSAGPLGVGLFWEKHKDQGTNGPAAAATQKLDDKIWGASAAYTFGPVKFGGVYTRQRFDVIQAGLAGTPKGQQKLKTWTLGVDWAIVGPHGLRANYAHAGDVTGVSNCAPACAPNASGYIAGVNIHPDARAGTGVSFYQARYVFNFSKRTEFNFGYSKVRNKQFGAYTYSDLGAGTAAGTKPDAWVVALKHTF